MKRVLIFLFFLFGLINMSYQIDKTFPNPKMDDSIITETIFRFKGYSNQGYLLLEYENLKNINIYINGNKLNTKNLKENGKVKIDISKYTNDKDNTIQISNLKGKINIKIPYPEIIETKNKNYNKNTIELLDEIVKSEINSGFPSAQLAVIKSGKLEIFRSYGYVNNYDKQGNKLENRIKVDNETIYDLASNTKMYATNYAIMKLVSDKKINLDDFLSKYFSGFDKNGKEKIQISDLLKHQAGFPADPQYFNEKYDKDDGILNGKNDLYAIGKDNILNAISQTPLIYKPKMKTKYSDVDYMLLGFIVEKVTGLSLEEYLKTSIYDVIGLKYTMFNPLEKGININKIAATELNGNTRDNKVEFINIRKDTIQGQVHDEKAFYSMDGMSGHAGLFSNAYEIAKLAQIILNDGGYGENTFFDKTTIDQFIKPKDSNSSYGLGWRRQGDYIYKWAFSSLASRNSIGHTGWTGTLTIIDPKLDLIIVLLTNAKNTRVVDPDLDPNLFEGDHYLTKNYGAITTLIFDAFINSNAKGSYLRMNYILEDIIRLRYEYIKNNKKYMTNVEYKNVLGLINLLEKRLKNIDKEFKEIREDLNKKIKDSDNK